MILSVDIETKCNQGCTASCKHALYPWTADITKIGVVGEDNETRKVFNTVGEFSNFISTLSSPTYLGQNFKFDLKHLAFKGLELPLSSWVHDTKSLAAVCLTKVSKEYLMYYEQKREELNKTLPRGYTHRKGSKYSLKVLAPYFLDVEPFWEDPTDHANDEYVLKDCSYTLRLYHKLLELTKEDGTYEFYEKYLMPWSRMLVEAELTGIKLDLKELQKAEYEAREQLREKELTLSELWKEPEDTYYKQQLYPVREKYQQMEEKALARLKNKTEEKVLATKRRYGDLCLKALKKIPRRLNYDSPSQMLWLFKEYLGLQVQDDKGKDSIGKPVLMYYSHKREDVRAYLDYKKYSKLTTAFFPTYKELQHEGTLHCNFNPTGTRTGRLSSSDPNLQQVPGALHSIFISRPGHMLATYDMSAIEAALIAYYSEDPILLDIIFSGTDFHGFNTKLYFPNLECEANEVKKKHKPLRDFAKTLGYALFYGAGAGRVKATAQKNGEDWPYKKCQEIVENLKETYRQVFEFKRSIDNIVLEQPIKNIFGRQQFFEDPNEIYMKNFNTLIQSSASDIVLESARKLSEVPWMKVLLLVHDEIVIEIPEEKKEEAEQLIPEVMTDYKLETSKGLLPLKAEGVISKQWEKG